MDVVVRRPLNSRIGSMKDQTQPVRAMWIINHTTARKFEVPMLKSLGISEIFLPKLVPATNEFRSCSIDWSEDANLTIPKDDLDILNRTNWYERPLPDAWRIANRHFDIAFVIASSTILQSAIDRFDSALVFRAYGFDKTANYSSYFQAITGGQAKESISQMKKRFWFGEAYDNIHQNEPSYLAKRRLFLPAGLNATDTSNDWTGNDRRLMFVCPDAFGNPYYRKIYYSFCDNFRDFDYVVGGQQYAKTSDPRILGLVPAETHRSNMRNFRVMFYHSDEPRHLHYHPLEAIAAGMPLVYMAGGMLDRFGGDNQPGRCLSIEEARSKIRRVLDDDTTLINEIRERQRRILDHVSVEYCHPFWKRSIKRAFDGLSAERKRAERNERIQQLSSRLLSRLKPSGGLKQNRRSANIGAPSLGPSHLPSSPLGLGTPDIDWLS
jgi:hypothetical protein